MNKHPQTIVSTSLPSESSLSNPWLNDAVKGFLGGRGDFDPYLELPNLRVYVARPEYLLAMKCASM